MNIKPPATDLLRISTESNAALALARRFLKPPINFDLLNKGAHNSTYLVWDINQMLIIRLTQKYSFGRSNLAAYQQAARAAQAAGQAGVPVGEIILTGDRLFPYIYQVYKYVDGYSGNSFPGNEMIIWSQLGKMARKINQVRTIGFGDNLFDMPGQSWPDYISARSAGILKFQRNPSNRHLRQTVTFTAAELNEFKRLMSPLPDIAADTRLVHIDLMPRNVIVDAKGEIVGVIDWDHAKSFPLEHQIAVATFWNTYPEAKASQRRQSFLDGYGCKFNPQLIKAFMVYEYLTQLPYKTPPYQRIIYNLLRGLLYEI